MSFITVSTKNISDELKNLVALSQRNIALKERQVVATESIAQSLVTIVETLNKPPIDEAEIQEKLDELTAGLRKSTDKLGSSVEENSPQQ